MEQVDLAIVGAGAAGLMAGIQARRAGCRQVVILDSARRPGAKILVSGGGRCNVTHDQVDESAFCGSTPPAIRKVLRRFDVAGVVAFFQQLGVPLKREATGKLFPVTDQARTVLEALLRAAREAGAELRHPCRVESVRLDAGRFLLEGPGAGAAAWNGISARRLILATGGRSLPRSGSDGHGYDLARSLGHSVTPRIFPALVPLTLPTGHPLCGLAGLSAPVELEVRSAGGQIRIRHAGPLLCAHFGLSGPAVLDVSRHLIDARADDPGAGLVVSWLPGERPASAGALLGAAAGAGPLSALRGRLPERLARTLIEMAGVDPAAPAARMPRDRRLTLAGLLTGMPVPVTGDRGWNVAEVTAGGVPLAELRLDTMESRVRPGLSLCGEICDVDGRIGGYNFQWAWASGFVAGRGAASLSV